MKIILRKYTTDNREPHTDFKIFDDRTDLALFDEIIIKRDKK